VHRARRSVGGLTTALPGPSPTRTPHPRFGGADNSSAAVGSLWSAGNALALDLPMLAYQLRAQGFNSIRLPFSFDDLRAPPKKMWDKQGCRKVGAPAAAAREVVALVEPPGRAYRRGVQGGRRAPRHYNATPAQPMT
jgi:hypothetical protein